MLHYTSELQVSVSLESSWIQWGPTGLLTAHKVTPACLPGQEERGGSRADKMLGRRWLSQVNTVCVRVCVFHTEKSLCCFCSLWSSEWCLVQLPSSVCLPPPPPLLYRKSLLELQSKALVEYKVWSHARATLGCNVSYTPHYGWVQKKGTTYDMKASQIWGLVVFLCLTLQLTDYLYWSIYPENNWKID